MNDIMEKTFLLIDELENSDIIRDITFYKERLLSNKEIKELIDRGKKISDEYVIRDIRKKLYGYEDYKGYMDNYNELMYIVMDINNRMNKLINKNSCIR